MVPILPPLNPLVPSLHDRGTKAKEGQGPHHQRRGIPDFGLMGRQIR